MVTRFKIGQPLSQASLREEGATTIPCGVHLSRWKCGTPYFKGDDIVYSCRKLQAVNTGHKLATYAEYIKMIQGRLYWRIINANLKNDYFFKDFELMNYRFIVVNKYTLTPLVWEFPLTKTYGTLIDKNGNKYRDPYEIGAELQSYLDLRPRVPKGIDVDGVNIIDCLKKVD